MRAFVPMIAFVACALLMGCGTTGVYRDWDAPMEFRFASLTENEASAYQGVFDYHEVVTTRKDTKDAIVFVVDDVESTWHLARIMHSINNKSEELNLESRLELATFDYSGLNTSAALTTIVTISVPRGASACIADGPERDPWRPVPVKDDGTWKGPVKRGGITEKLDGWVYVAATRDGVFHRYFRVNMITGQQQRIDFATVRSAGLKQPVGCSR